MQSSNLATRRELAAPDLLSQPPRPALQLVTNIAPLQPGAIRPRASFEIRTIVIRDQGLRSFRVF
jgi:hypothetical protein